jgi:hypothetical protein
LRCEHKDGWQFLEGYKSKWNIKTAEPNEVSIRIDSDNLKVYLNGNEELSDKPIACDNKNSLGFFNEVNNVYISNLSINVI